MDCLGDPIESTLEFNPVNEITLIQTERAVPIPHVPHVPHENMGMTDNRGSDTPDQQMACQPFKNRPE